MQDSSGHYEILPDYNVLICRVSEHWGALEGAERFVSDISKAVSGFAGQPWCRVVNMVRFKLATDEVIERMHEFGLWSLENGCLEHAFIFSNDRQREQVEAAYRDLFNIQAFKGEQEAIAHCCRTLRADFLRRKAGEDRPRIQLSNS